jgi:hypothetical protein
MKTLTGMTCWKGGSRKCPAEEEMTLNMRPPGAFAVSLQLPHTGYEIDETPPVRLHLKLMTSVVKKKIKKLSGSISGLCTADPRLIGRGSLGELGDVRRPEH